MTIPRMRPRFSIPVALSPDQTLNRLRGHLKAGEHLCTGEVVHRHAIVTIQKDVRTFWSPVMDFEVTEADEGASLEGKFGPHPDVWTMFVAIYALEAILATAGLMYGASQWTLGQYPSALWAVALAAVLGLATYGSAFVGQALSARQMHRLERFLQGALADPSIDSDAPEP